MKQTGNGSLAVVGETESFRVDDQAWLLKVSESNGSTCPVEQVACDYGDNSGNVAPSGLQNVIGDFIDGNISLGELQTVIQAFISGP